MPAADAVKAAAQRTIDAAADELRALSLDIHAHPELNYEEVHAHALLTGYLEGQGFAVERGAYGLPTAFAARAGSGRPTIGLLCEYDALPGIGHACGHNLIAIAGVAAGLALQSALGDGDGTVLLLGSPAEEGGGGKIEMLEHGAFDGVDAALMVHPSRNDSVWANVLAIQVLTVQYHGKNAHASSSPWDGLNALDAIVLAYNAISALRQQLPPDTRVHGVITQGGERPNIIPDLSAAEFYLRAADDAGLERLKQRVLACFQGSAQATGCRLESEWVGRPYSNLATNDPIAEAFLANAEALGKSLPTKQAGLQQSPAASTDMGNVSHVVPALHPFFAIPTEAGNHSPEFTQAAATPAAHAETIRAAKAMAMTALDLCADPHLLARAQQHFRSSHPQSSHPQSSQPA